MMISFTAVSDLDLSATNLSALELLDLQVVCVRIEAILRSDTSCYSNILA